jgi:hypothetical protein
MFLANKPSFIKSRFNIDFYYFVLITHLKPEVPRRFFREMGVRQNFFECVRHEG